MKSSIKRAAVALMLVAAVALQVACSALGSNAIVATVAGENIYRWELDLLYDKNIEYYQDSTGIDLSKAENTEKKTKFRQALLEELVREAAVVQWAKENGYDLNDEEKAEVETEYQQKMAAKIASYKENELKDKPNADQEAVKLWKKELETQHLTEESLKHSIYNTKVFEKLTTDVYKDVAVSDAEIKETYDQIVSDQKKDYTDNPASYGEEAKYPSGKIMYNPAGFVRVKQIFIALPEEIDKQIIELDQKRAEAIKEKAMLEQEKGSGTTAAQEVEKQSDELDKQVEALYAKAYAEIRPKAEEALKKAKAGEDFDKLIEEYGEDPSMVNGPLKTVGYLVGSASEDLLSGFKEIALSVKNVGDVSEIGNSNAGFHIVKLVEIIPEGPIPMNDEIKNFIIQLISANPQFDAMNKIQNEAMQHFEDAKQVKLYLNKI